MRRRIANVDTIDTTDMTKKDENAIDDDDQTLIEMLVLGLRTLSEVRCLCLRSNENFHIAEKLQEKADRIHFEADCHKQRYLLRNGSVALFQESFHRERAYRYERSAQMRLQTAFKELKTAYLIVNKNGRMQLPVDTDPTAMAKYAKTFGFLGERYDRSMIHVGAGRLPSFRRYKYGDKSSLFLGKIISNRQLKLLTTVITQIEDDLKKSRMGATKRLYLRYAIPWSVSFRTFHRGNVLVVQ